MQNGEPPGETSLSPTRILVAGIASAAIGIVLFLGVHAVLIMPVWPTPLRIVAAVAVGLFVSFLPMFSLCGVVLAATRAALVSR